MHNNLFFFSFDLWKYVFFGLIKLISFKGRYENRKTPQTTANYRKPSPALSYLFTANYRKLPQTTANLVQPYLTCLPQTTANYRKLPQT